MYMRDYWYCMDSSRDYHLLNHFWSTGDRSLDAPGAGDTFGRSLHKTD